MHARLEGRVSPRVRVRVRGIVGVESQSGSRSGLGLGLVLAWEAVDTGSGVGRLV